MSQQPQLPESALGQLFVAVNGERGLRQLDGDPPVMFAEILQYIRGNTRIDSDRIEQAVDSQMHCRRIFNRLLAQQRRAFAPKEARADDTTTIELRETRAFSLKFRVSKADARQVYVILSVRREADIVDGRAISLLAVKDEQVKRLQFPALHDGQAQVILLIDDQRLALLRDAETELSLI